MLKSCEAEKEEYLNLSKRLKADFTNLKKDVEESTSKIVKYANEGLILEMLPILDSLELSLKHVPEDLRENNWVKGMLSIRGQFENILKSMGVFEIKCIGEKFDPSLHESVSEEESDKEGQTILEEIQKGYKFNDRVIRASKVKISK